MTRVTLLIDTDAFLAEESVRVAVPNLSVEQFNRLRVMTNTTPSVPTVNTGKRKAQWKTERKGRKP